MSKSEPLLPEMSGPAASLRAMVDGKIVSLAKKRRSGFTKPQVLRARMGMEQCARSGDWSKAGPAMLVALYEWMHRTVYEVDAGDLDNRSWMFASTAAKRMLEQEFASDYSAMVEFMRWVWKREEAREKWRRENNRIDGNRIGWRFQFVGGHLVTDFRIAMSRMRRK